MPWSALLGRFRGLLIFASLLGTGQTKWVEGRIDTKDNPTLSLMNIGYFFTAGNYLIPTGNVREATSGKLVYNKECSELQNWAFVARFCFLSLEGQFEYLIEFDREAGTPNLLLYYDDDNQWPAVYHSSKSCQDREAILNKAGQNQVIKLSHWYPDTEVSGCVLTKQNKALPASKNGPTSTTAKPTPKTPSTKQKNATNTTKPPDPSYYNQFLKTTTLAPITTIVDSNATIWYELQPTDFNTSTMIPEEQWESIGTEKDEIRHENLDVELLFTNTSHRKIKRSNSELYERFRRRRLNADSNNYYSKPRTNTDKYIVSCHNSRRFKSARERWWFIAISNCESNKGLDIRYRFLMTNGPDGDFWHEHFSADEFYVLPVLLAYACAYLIIIVAVVMCSIELRCRHLLHSTYKMFVISTILQHSGIVLQSLAKIKYASNGFGGEDATIVGQFLCGMSETTFMLVLVLMGKGYTITRARLKVSFTVKLTVFMCSYIVTYVVLFVYQAKAFDPGEVLYLYESPAGYGLIVLRVVAWCMFAYSIFFTVRKYPEKNTFYGPFSICGTLWFFAGPLFILTANSYIDKWVRESVVAAVLLFITFCGHVMFLMLTLPVFANKNFPYHVRTTQIGVMEVTGNPEMDRFGRNPYAPTNGAAQTVIIPLTRRTEEIIGNMYTPFIASAPHMSLENERTQINGIDKQATNSLSPKNLTQQDSVETNNSDDIKPYVNANKEIFTVEGQMSKIEQSNSPESLHRDVKTDLSNTQMSTVKSVLPAQNGSGLLLENGVDSKIADSSLRGDLPSVLRSRRNILEPIKRDVPSWSLAKGPAVVDMLKKPKPDEEEDPESPVMINGRKVPPVRNGLQSSSGEISTILEGRVQSYKNVVSQPTIDLFSARKNT